MTISGNTITVDPEATNSLSLTLLGGSGEILGSFVDPTSSNTNTIHGVMLQGNTNAASGFFLGTSQGGLFNLFGN